MADDDDVMMFDEMDIVADATAAGSTFADDLWIAFCELLAAHRPALNMKPSHAQFDDWRRHYEARLRDREAAADAKAARLWAERGRLEAQRKFLPPGPLRQAAEARLWAIGKEIGRIYQSRRPAPLAAKWAADSES